MKKWPVIFLAGIIVLAVTFSPLINEPQCTYDQIVQQDSDNCISGANIGAGWLILLSGFMIIIGGIGSIITLILSIAKTNKWGQGLAWLIITAFLSFFMAILYFLTDLHIRSLG